MENMTNKQLIKKWKRLSIAFNTEKIKRPLCEIFMICWGETEVEVDGKKEQVVLFDTGGEQGSPALHCNSDKNDVCWAFGYNSKTKAYTKAKIGKFVKND